MRLPEPDAVRRHFEARAREYDDRSGRGFWSLLRRRETRAVLDLLRPAPGENILDAGSGAGHYTAELVRAGARVTALDLSGAMLEALRRRLAVETLEGDLAQVALPPRFDKVLCAGALEFVADPAAAVANLARSLRPGGPGEVVLLLPRAGLVGHVYRAYHRRHGFRVNLFDRAALEGIVAAAEGFVLDSLGRVTFNYVLRMRRRPDAPPREA